jgi:indole-3-glycerol phosphate synthase
LNTSLQLAEAAPPGATLVAESGLRTRADIERLQGAGYKAFLIGETLMRSSNARAELAALQGLEAVR